MKNRKAIKRSEARETSVLVKFQKRKSEAERKSRSKRSQSINHKELNTMANLTTITQEQIDRCSRKVDAATNRVYYEVQSESSDAIYEVRYNRERHCFTCTCPSGKDGFQNCHVNPTCKHCRWSVAAENQHQTERRIERESDLENAMESRSAEEIQEQAAIQSYVNQGVDRETAERVIYAPDAEPGPKGHLGYFANTGFSLLK